MDYRFQSKFKVQTYFDIRMKSQRKNASVPPRERSSGSSVLSKGRVSDREESLVERTRRIRGEECFDLETLPSLQHNQARDRVLMASSTDAAGSAVVLASREEQSSRVSQRRQQKPDFRELFGDEDFVDGDNTYVHFHPIASEDTLERLALKFSTTVRNSYSKISRREGYF